MTDVNSFMEIVIFSCLGCLGVGFALGYAIGFHQGLYTEEKK
jgi:hypothetical protein